MPAASTTEFAAPPDGASPLRGLHSLRHSHVATLSRILEGRDAGWSLTQHESYDGDLSVILMPQYDTDAALVVSRSAAGFHLATNQGDDYQALGCFASLDALMAAMQASLTAQ